MSISCINGESSIRQVSNTNHQIGTWIASNLPWLVNKLGVTNEAEAGIIPISVVVAFRDIRFILSILYTVFTTKEDPLKTSKKFKQVKKGQFLQ
jgi:maltose/moltooligosaccharide transporter